MQLRFHGTGNAWPVPLGQDHPFYDRNHPGELSNAAYSILSNEGSNLLYEVVVDAGHGTIQSLLSTTNRIPEAVCLTHGHLDHTLSLDWIVQSYARQYGKGARYPVYCTRPVFEILCNTYPHLEGLIDYHELSYGTPSEVQNTSLQVTAFPVYHGPGASGASMLLFVAKGSRKRILFTGDLLSPLLRKRDVPDLEGVDLVVCDGNNRFPYPRSNHWSILHVPGDRSVPFLKNFLSDLTAAKLLIPHDQQPLQTVNRQYLDQFTGDLVLEDQPFVLMDFLKLITPLQVAIVHYSGSEDKKYYDHPVLSRKELSDWLAQLIEIELPEVHFTVPGAGDVLNLAS